MMWSNSSTQRLCSLNASGFTETPSTTMFQPSAEDVGSQKAAQRVLGADFGHKCQGEAQHNKIGISSCQRLNSKAVAIHQRQLPILKNNGHVRTA